MTMVSVGKESEAKNIAKALVEQKLAVCAAAADSVNLHLARKI